MSTDRLEIITHPVAQQLLSRLRDAATPPSEFAAALALLSRFLAHAASAHLPTREISVTTPLETTTGVALAHPVALVPILRAGLGLMDGFLALFPHAAVGHIGLARDEKTLQPRTYLEKFPSLLGPRTLFVLDPMLATGGSATYALKQLKSAGAKHLILCSVLAAPEGVARVQQDHPEVLIITAALDRQLNERGYILPGLGDAGDRLCGTLDEPT